MAARAKQTAGNATAAGVPASGKDDSNKHPEVHPRSSGIAAAGVKTGEDFANLMSALMSDIIEGSITPIVANATVNAGGKLLKVVEMQYRYGQPKSSAPMTLTLATGTDG